MMFLYKMCVSCLPIYAMWKGPRNSDGFWVRHIFLGPGHHRTLHPSFVGKHHVIVVYIYLDYRSVVSGGVLWEEGNLPQHLIGFHLFFPKKDGYFWHVYRFFSHENWKPLLFIGFFPKMMGFHSFFPIKIALFGAFPYFPAPHLLMISRPVPTEQPEPTSPAEAKMQWKKIGKWIMSYIPILSILFLGTRIILVVVFDMFVFQMGFDWWVC